MQSLKQTDIDDYITHLDAHLSQIKASELKKSIVNAPFQNPMIATMLSLGVTVLLLVNKQEGVIDRVALSNTEAAQGAVEYSVKPFHEIKIPLGYEGNIIAAAIETKHYQITNDWKFMFVPALKPEEARFNQAGAGIGCSVVYPLSSEPDGGAMIFSFYDAPPSIGEIHHQFMLAYSTLVSKYVTHMNTVTK